MFESGGNDGREQATAHVPEAACASVLGDTLHESVISSFRRDLSAALEEPGDRADAARVDAIRALEELVCVATAAQAHLAAELDESQRETQAAAGEPASRQGRGVGSLVGWARRESPHRGRRHLGLATVVRAELPCTWRAWRDGHITEWAATVVARETACLTRDDRLAVDATVCGDPVVVERMGIRELAAAVHAESQRLDPAAEVKRRRRAESERCVSLRPAPDTMTWLSALLPVADGVATFAALARAADAARAVGDERGRGQVMADTLVESVLGNAGHGGNASAGDARRDSDPAARDETPDPDSASGSALSTSGPAPTPASAADIAAVPGSVGGADLSDMWVAGREPATRTDVHAEAVGGSEIAGAGISAPVSLLESMACRLLREAPPPRVARCAGFRGWQSAHGTRERTAGHAGSPVDLASAPDTTPGSDVGPAPDPRPGPVSDPGSDRDPDPDPDPDRDRDRDRDPDRDPGPVLGPGPGRVPDADPVSTGLDAEVPRRGPGLPAGVGVTIGLVVSDQVLFGESDETGWVEGYGPVPGELVRELVADACSREERVWIRRLYTRPDVGDLVTADARARLFPPALARMVKLRDRTCRTPWCDAAIRQIDHVVNHADGGPTSVANAQGLCEACNHAKQAPGWSARPDRDADGPHVVETTTPTGHRYRSPAPSLQPMAGVDGLRRSLGHRGS